MLEKAVLEPVEEAEVLILVDNFVDIYLAGSENVHRPPTPENVWYREEHLRSEHGIAMLLTVKTKNGRSSILYDAGIGRDKVLHNLDVLELRPGDLRATVLSHGHVDHHGGLEGILRRLGRPGLPLLLHPDAWMHRRLLFPTGVEMGLPPPSRRAGLDAEGVQIVEERAPRSFWTTPYWSRAKSSESRTSSEVFLSTRRWPEMAGNRILGCGTTKRSSSTSGTEGWSYFLAAVTRVA